MSRKVGIHIRLQNGLQEGLEKAARLGLNVYQSFLMDEAGNYFELSEKDIQSYVKSSKELGIDLIIHTAYWSNITRLKGRGFATLKEEAAVASQLQKKFLIVHPGSIKGMSDDPDVRAKKIAEAVNNFVETFSDITLLLENSPHGGLSFGGNLEDFQKLLQYIEHKDRIGFCIDTSHAHAYGYDITQSCEQFIDEIERTISCSRVYVLHVNDTLEKKGSKIDRHGIFGEGAIGLDCLKKIIQHRKLSHTAVILELPKMDEAEEEKTVNMVKEWTEEEII